MILQITENLDLDIAEEEWKCHHCTASLGDAQSNYKEGCLVADRDPREIWQPLSDEDVNFSFNPDWCRIVEFYCPQCAWLIELEVLPPGHPITHDIDLDIDKLRDKATRGELSLEPKGAN